MAHLPAPNDPDTEAALAKLIEKHLSLHGVNVSQSALIRVRQQLSVTEFLDQILDAGRCDGGDEPLMVDVAAAGSTDIDDGVVSDVGLSVESDMALTSDPTAEAETPAGLQVEVQESDGKAHASNITSIDAVTPQQKASMPIFRLLVPNATADMVYSHHIDLSKEPVVAGYRISSITGLEDIGLGFDYDANRLHGTPRAEPGKSVQHDLEVELERRDERTVRAAARLSLFINPHPRTLWKQIEPDTALEFRKEHRRKHYEAGPPHVLVASVRGRSHENSGSFREDDFHIGRDAGGQWTVIAVSDGAGSAKLSRLGSQIVTQTAVAYLVEALERNKADIDLALETVAGLEIEAVERAKKLEDICKKLLREPVGRAAFEASKEIKAKASELGVEEKALSATLMFAAVRRIGDAVLVASYWIGDGAAALLNPKSGDFQLLGEADSGEFSGQTRFLLPSEFQESTAWESIDKRFRCKCVSSDTKLLLMTDGVSDPKFGTDNALRDPACWLKFLNEDLAAALPLSEPSDDIDQQLEEYLQFWSKGEHDDRTLALVYWT